MGVPRLNLRSDQPDFLDLPWERSIVEWDPDRLADLPTGIHRHEIVFVPYAEAIFAIKELPLAAARNEYRVLRDLEERGAPVVQSVGMVERPWIHPSEEAAAAVITRYLEHAFSYRELLSGSGFGPRRTQLLDGFAGLLVELHLAGCFWGDCSLSNVLYRYDGPAIDVTMVDGETAQLHEELTRGQRLEDLEIMIENVAGGMADIAAENGADLDQADLELGEDITERYHGLWAELGQEVVIGRDERYRLSARIERLHQLGFHVSDVELEPVAGGDRLRLKVRVGGRNYHADRLRELTGIDATENQARQLLADLQYSEARSDGALPSGKALAAIRWRVGVFEPMLARIAAEVGDRLDPLQGYADFLHHRFVMATGMGRDVDNEEAFADWVARGHPGYPLEDGG